MSQDQAPDMDITVVPSYAIIDYAWALIKANTSLTEADYGGRIPIIPASQQPELTQYDKPHLVYAWSESPTYDPFVIRTGQITFAVYSENDREVGRITNLLTTAFGRFDETAEDINVWKQNGVFAPIRFVSLWCGAYDGPSPESTEGGRQSGVVMVRFRYVADFTYVKP